MHDLFYFTDVHGQMQLFMAMMKWIEEQDDSPTIVFGGDACDRGEHGFAIMTELLENPNVIYIKGNHEDLFVKSAHALHKIYPSKMWTYDEAKILVSEAMQQDEDVYLHIYNGGLVTLAHWMMNGMDMDFVNAIENLPVVFRHVNHDFSHAGGSPRSFQSCIDAMYNDKELPAYEEKTMIWDRNCLGLGWFPNRICIHGHTPTISLPAAFYGSKDKSESTIRPAWWRGPFDKERFPGLKIDMDTGMTWTGRAWVLNCNTMVATSFFDLNVNQENSVHDIKIGLENYKIK